MGRTALGEMRRKQTLLAAPQNEEVRPTVAF
jgi:hypothetical protein